MWAVTIILCASWFVGAGAAEVIPATAAIWQGRTVRDEGAGTAAFAWEGTQASFTVRQSTSVSAVMASSLLAHTVFHVYIDGNLTGAVVVSGESHNYTLASNLNPATTHVVTLWYIIDPIVLSWPKISTGNITMFAFGTDGAFGPVPAPLTRRLQIVGDSITAGNQIDNTTCAADHSGTYEAHLCSYFGANCTTLAISGYGLFENCCPVLGNTTMTSLVGLTIPSDPSSTWDDAAFVPDAVMINLGTNDNGRNNGTQEWVEGFVLTYVQFLVNLTVTHKNPNLPIFCTIGPITHTPAPWISQAMQLAEAKGLTNLHMITYTAPTDRCGHPNYTSHEIMYQQARPVLSQVLGWD